MLDDLHNMVVNGIGKGLIEPRATRKHKAMKTEVGSLVVSTVNTHDMGWETAIIDKVGTHPVERYPRHINAVAGHAKWVAIAPKLREVIELGYGSLIAARYRKIAR